MRLFPNPATVLIAAAAIHAAAAGIGCADDKSDDPAHSAAVPPLAVAAQGATASTWTIITTEEFNLDGLADVLWFDTANQAIMIWLMDGTRPLAIGPVIAGPQGDGWEASNAFDFSSDGIGDIFWRNSKKNLFTIWLMNGTEPLVTGPVIAGPGEGWVASAHGDVNGDGMADLVWYNAEKNAFTVWLLNGTAVLTRGPILP